MHLGRMISLSLGLAVSVNSQLRFFFYFCSITWGIETALGNIKEDLVVDIHILVNFSVLKCPVKFPGPF